MSRESAARLARRGSTQPDPAVRRISALLFALWLSLWLSTNAAAADLVRVGDGAERSFHLTARLGAGFDSNVRRDPEASLQSALLRLDLDGELQLGRRLLVSLNGFLEEPPPSWDQDQLAVQLTTLYRLPLRKRWTLRAGAHTEFQRELVNYVAGTIQIHGAVRLSTFGEHALLGAGLKLGRFDLEATVQGHAKVVSGDERFNVFGVDGSLALRWVPLRQLAVRVRALYLFEVLSGLPLFDRDGMDSGFSHDLNVRTEQLDVTVRGRPVEAVDIFARYEFSYLEDNYVGYLLGTEHRLVTGARYSSERYWIVDLLGKLVRRDYPLRRPSLDNQVSDLGFEVAADAELWLRKHVGVFARYEVSGETAAPFGTLFVRHAILAGVAGRLVRTW